MDSLPLALSEWPQDVQKRSQRTIPTISGCKRAVFEKCLFSLGQTSICEDRWAKLRSEHPPFCGLKPPPRAIWTQEKKASLGNTLWDHRRLILPQTEHTRFFGSATFRSGPMRALSSPGPFGAATRRPQEVSRHDLKHIWMQKSGFRQMLVFPEQNKHC